MAQLKVHTGSGFVDVLGKVYNGTSWVDKMKFYDGTSWVDLFTAAVVTLSGEAIASVGVVNQVASLRILNDGTMQKGTTGGGFVQIDSGTDWIIPNASADSTYDARIVSTPPTNDFDNKPVANGSWISLGTTRTWDIGDTSSGDGSRATGNFTVEIRKDGGAALDSGTYSLDAEKVI